MRFDDLTKTAKREIIRGRRHIRQAIKRLDGYEEYSGMTIFYLRMAKESLDKWLEAK